MFTVRGRVVVLAVLGSALLAGCGPGDTEAPAVTTGSAIASSQSSAPPAPRTSVPEPVPVVVLDPGHNGGNAAAPGEVNRKVPAGRGRTKACNTTGTATDAGYAEHAFNFDVANRVSDILTAQGVHVIFTREDNTGVGPCVDERARIGNDSGADAVVSIHADGATDPGARGFHIAHSAPALNEAQGAPAQELARELRADLLAADFPLSTYIGEGGLSPRDDLAGMNLSTRPSVLLECGNMRNPAEAAMMSTPDGRQRYADAIAAGIASYLDL